MSCPSLSGLSGRPNNTRSGSFLHGGAWRDPRDTYQDFYPAIEKILASPEVDAAAIAGFASLNYRLSPYIESPDGASAVSAHDHEIEDPVRALNAKHPDHIKDVWLALDYLQHEFRMGGRYILIGHSAGATLALQLLMGSTVLGPESFHCGLPCESLDAAAPAFQRHSRHHKKIVPGELPLDILPPFAIIGVAGIYEFFDLNERMGKAYTGFFTGAFGDNPEAWNDAAPARFRGDFTKTFPGTRLVMLAWSPEDEYIDEPEIDGMAKVLATDGVQHTIVKDIPGSHNFAWEDGSPIARLVAQLLRELSEVDTDYPYTLQKS